MHIVLLARVVLVQCYAATSDEALHNYPATKPELAWLCERYKAWPDAAISGGAEKRFPLLTERRCVYYLSVTVR
jgi:hypothetical protein